MLKWLLFLPHFSACLPIFWAQDFHFGIAQASNFGVLIETKRMQSPHRLLGVSERDKTFTTHWSDLVRLLSSNLSPSSSPCLSSGNHFQMLFQKVMPGNRRFWMQKQWLCSWGSTQVGCKRGMEGQLGRASANTRHFRGCSSCCGQLQQWQACFRKKCCSSAKYWHSSRAKYIVNFGQWQWLFSSCANKIDGFWKNVSVLIAWFIFLPSIGFCANTKFWNKQACSKLDPVQTQQGRDLKRQPVQEQLVCSANRRAHWRWHSTATSNGYMLSFFTELKLWKQSLETISGNDWHGIN